MIGICAVSRNNVFAKDGNIPWRLNGDMKNFRELTLNNVVIMGRKTYESIGHPLKDRINIVVSSTIKGYKDIIVVDNIIDSLILATSYKKKIFIIGGVEIIKFLLPYMCEFILTLVDTDIEGDNLLYFDREIIKDYMYLTSIKKFYKDKNNEYNYDILFYKSR